jgi:uncharacterized protein YndB with AHSA1/START domain
MLVAIVYSFPALFVNRSYRCVQRWASGFCRSDTPAPRPPNIVPGAGLESRSPMGPVSAEIEIDSPRERVFATIADLARRPSFTDHFLTDFHLTRIDPSGIGAGARFRVASPLRSVWMDTVIAELEPPHKIVERGRGGRGNRIPATTVWELTEGSGGLTRVRVSRWTEPSHPLDRGLEVLAANSAWEQRGWREALRRLRDRLESDEAAPAPIAVAGGNAHATGIP